jgi:DNA-binding MarR family transcriptional regulator/N-acetylglutamate synthase-like GNAT family acetyltransferase
LKSPFSLTEARVLYELAHQENLTAAELGRELELDAGYLSRILGSFEKRGLISRNVSKADGRQSLMKLTPKGRKAFAPLNARSNEEVAEMLRGLAPAEQRRLVKAMETIEGLLESQTRASVPFILRPPQPGDMGLVVQCHGVLYSEEYGWDERFEGLVAEIVAKFIDNYDPKRERCWIAEKDGEMVGSVFLVKQTDDVAKLRLLLVEPAARGLGIGARLISECVRFARQAGYSKITLWTNSVLRTARHLYERAGFILVSAESHESFGQDLVAETWELTL